MRSRQTRQVYTRDRVRGGGKVTKLNQVKGVSTVAFAWGDGAACRCDVLGALALGLGLGLRIGRGQVDASRTAQEQAALDKRGFPQ